jgi:thiol:disulfide interchange protein DsbD
LVWVFGQQTGVGGATYLLSGLLLVSAAGWMVGRWNRTDRRSGIAARAVALGALFLAALLVAKGEDQLPPAMAATEGWQAFSQSELEGTLATGRPAFVDFTAAWCLTCQVNERLVLSSERVMDAFQAQGVALFKADWTRQDPAITLALERLGRRGVPVYVLYSGGGGSPPTLLPAILTKEIVLGALEEVLSP